MRCTGRLVVGPTQVPLAGGGHRWEEEDVVPKKPQKVKPQNPEEAAKLLFLREILEGMEGFSETLINDIIGTCQGDVAVLCDTVLQVRTSVDGPGPAHQGLFLTEAYA